MDDWGAITEGLGSLGEKAGGGPSAPSSQVRFHLPLLLWGLAGAAAGTVIGCVVFALAYRAEGGNVALVGGTLGVIAACVLLCCGLCERLHPRVTVGEDWSWVRLLLALAGGAAVCLAGCLGEFLYEMGGFRAPRSFDDYVFVIDDSGSMSSTDGRDLRYSALEQLLDSMGEERRVGLVRFQDGVYVPPVELAALDDGHRQRLKDEISRHIAEGGTDIYGALTAALELCRQGRQSGREMVTVLLSDGDSSYPVPSDEVVREFADEGVTINSAGLGDAANETLLRQLAEGTGGQYFKVERAEDLLDSFQRISTARAERCLFTPRPAVQRLNPFYMLLRVVFLAVPGALIGLFLWLMLWRGPSALLLVTCAAAGVLAGLVMELGTLAGVPVMLTHILSWLLYGVVLARYVERDSGIRQTHLKQRDIDGVALNSFQDFMARKDGGEGETGKLSRPGDGRGAGRIERGGESDWRDV